jgi:hypothetical protein
MINKEIDEKQIFNCLGYLYFAHASLCINDNKSAEEMIINTIHKLQEIFPECKLS